MSAMGRCVDNAAVESFFGVLKRERVNRRYYRTRAEAPADIVDSIERRHNPPAAETRNATTAGTTLNPTIRDIGIEPGCCLHGSISPILMTNRQAVLPNNFID